ncbi:MAG: hypothetical protein ACRDD7_13245 [Peptostreptococcaceae bacterium]
MEVDTDKKPLYKTLNSEQKVEYVLEQQVKGLNRKDIYILMGYAKVKNLDDFMKGKGYIKDNEVFVLSSGGKEESNGIQVPKVIENTENHIIESKRSQEGVIGHLSTLQDINVQEKLINMLNQYEEYEEMLKWYKSQGSHMGGDNTVVEVITGLEINYPKTTNMKTSIRLDAKIWSRFKDVADNKFNHVDNPSLLSQALYEFLEKYDK